MPILRRPCVAWLFAMVLALFPLAPSAQGQTPSLLTAAVSQVSSDGFPTVVANVTVVDSSGRPVLGLKPQAFELLEDGRPVKSVEVGTVVNSKEPLYVVLAIDVSGSMADRPIVDAKGAANTFVQGLGPADKAAVISFAETAKLVQPFTERKDELSRAIASLNAVGATALHDAVILAAQTVDQQKGGRRIVVLLSDGEDTASKAKAAEALYAIQAIQVPVFTVGLGPNVDRAVLDGLAAGSGGIALYAPSSADLTTAYRNIADQLRNQYTLTFASSLPPDNQRHTLTVRTKVGNAQAEARSTFVAVSVPPQITIVSPKEGEVVRGKVRVEVTAKGSGKIVRVDALAAGQVVGSKEQEPFVMEWDTSQLAGGNHKLDVAVTDSVGNRASKQVTVRVEAVPTPTRVPPTPTPTPTPVAPTGDGNEPLVLGLLGAGCLASVGLVLTRGRRLRSRHVVPMRKVVPPRECPTCGRRLGRGKDCPVCSAEDEKLIRRRVRELAGLPPDDDQQEEERP